MRYTHNIKLIKKRKHVLTISLSVTLLVIILIIVLGITTLDINKFFFGFGQSLVRVIISYFIALILAVLLALLVSYSEKVEAIALPILDVLQSFPSFALFPIFVVWFGRSSIVTILILIVSMIWPILFTLVTAQKQISSEIIEATHLFGAKGSKYIFYVLLPIMFPAIVTGSIVAWGEAWDQIIAAEIIISISGVGTYLALAGQNGQNSVLIVGILTLLLILFLINKYLWLSLLNISTKYQQ